MTYMTTWPSDGIPQYVEHATEAAAEAHALELVRSKKATVATAFAVPDEENQ